MCLNPRNMSGSSVTNKLVRPRTNCSSESKESCAEQELNGLEECEETKKEKELKLNARRVKTVGSHLKEYMARSQHKSFAPFGEKLATPISSEPLNRMSPRYKFGMWLGSEKQQCRVLRGKGAEGVFRAREVMRIEHQDRWDKEAINYVIGVPWRIADGKWTLDMSATQIETLKPPTRAV